MPSPFPGMDPYIEMSSWGDFHTNLAVEIQRRLVGIQPKYIARVQERIYIETERPEPRFIPDIVVSRTEPRHVSARHAPGALALDIEPRTYLTPLPDERTERYLEVVDRESMEVVTVIEILSPTNKRRGSTGFRKYQKKRQESLDMPLGLIEIDLLRTGERMPTASPLLSSTDYCVMIHRRGNRPLIEVYEWKLRDRLPRIPIPLGNGDPDFVIDLQQAVEAIYDTSGYGYTLSYSKSLVPPPRADDAVWINQILAARAS